MGQLPITGLGNTFAGIYESDCKRINERRKERGRNREAARHEARGNIPAFQISQKRTF